MTPEGMSQKINKENIMVKRHLMNNKLAITLAASIAMTTVGGGVSAPLYAKESKEMCIRDSF